MPFLIAKNVSFGANLLCLSWTRPLYDRILHVVNHHAHYNLRPEGQEGFTVIQYGANDEYM